MKAFCGSVNVHGVVVLFAGGGDTSPLHDVIELFSVTCGGERDRERGERGGEGSEGARERDRERRERDRERRGEGEQRGEPPGETFAT